jgi:hypothetical protein
MIEKEYEDASKKPGVHGGFAKKANSFLFVQFSQNQE